MERKESTIRRLESRSERAARRSLVKGEKRTTAASDRLAQEARSVFGGAKGKGKSAMATVGKKNIESEDDRSR